MKKTERRTNPLWVQTALAVAESGSPACAAKRLGVSITTVYRRLDTLEQSIGFQIFKRHHTGWVLREEASVLLAAGREIERLLLHTEKVIRDAAGAGSGILRIAVSEDFANHYVTLQLHRFREACPGVRPDLVVSSNFADLVYGEADVAIRPHANPGDALIGRRVGRMTHAFYAAPGYIKRNGRPTSLSDVNNHRICGYGSALADYTAAQWLDANIEPYRIIAYFGSTGAMTRAVMEELGIGLLPCYVGDAIPSLRPVITIDRGLPVDIWLVTAAASRKRPMVQAFFTFFASAILSDANLFGGAPYAK